MKNLIIAIVLCLISTSLFAQDSVRTLKWSGDLRVRSELDNRDFNLSTPPNSYTLLRARVALEAVPTENVKVFFQLRDSRTFGQEKDIANAFSTTSDMHNLDLHQGYVEVKKIFLDEMTLKLGRMELSYGSERMIGSVGWHNVGRVFDGGLFRFDLEPMTLDLFAMNVAEVQNAVVTATPPAVAATPDIGMDFYGIYSSFKNIPNNKIDGYLLFQWNRNKTVPGQNDLARFTLGGYGKGSFDSWDYEAELAYQGGKQKGADVSAYMVTGNVGYTMANSTLSRVGVGAELLSGTAPGDTKVKAFDPPYPTGHKFYGFMDYFISIPANTGNLGLLDLLAKATLKFSDQWSTNLWMHNFTTAQDAGTGTALGQEIDLVTSYKYNKYVSFELGTCGFIPGNLTRGKFAGSDVGLWGYLSTMVSF